MHHGAAILLLWSMRTCILTVQAIIWIGFFGSGIDLLSLERTATRGLRQLDGSVFGCSRLIAVDEGFLYVSD